MKTKVIRIGNSRGIRLPKTVLNQVGINEEVNLEVKDNRIILKPVHKKRNGWDKAFQNMAAESDDRLLDGNEAQFQSSWDDDEWMWENE